MQLADRVLADLRAQRDELLAEFRHWCERSNQPGALVQHESQLVRITEILSALLSKLLAGGALALSPASSMSGLESRAAGVRDIGDLLKYRRRLGGAHFLWDFFRDKFAQRDTPLYADHLNAADTLAWHLYRPFWEAVANALEADPRKRATIASPDSLKEPPLSFYHVERTLLTQPRASVFRPPGLDAKDVDAFRAALGRLPIPIIGLPWYQARRMPALVLVGHEVGHVVSDDLGLGGHLDDLIGACEDIPESRRPNWVAWRDEVFSDVFGALALGTAYVDQLAVELANEFNTVVGESIRADAPGAYPTSALRIALCRAALERVGLDLPKRWYESSFPLAGDSGAYRADVAIIVEAMVEGPYPTLGDVGLRAILPWSQADEAAVLDVAEQSLAGREPTKAREVRHWVAGAVRARATNSTAYHRADLDGLLAERIARDFAGDRRSDACGRVRERLGSLMAPATESAFVVPAPSLPERDRRLGADLADTLGLMA